MKMIQKLLRSVLALSMAVQLLAVPALAVEKAPVYLALGDSISTGYGLAAPVTDTFVERVNSSLGYTLENRALDGNTANGIYQQLTDPTAVQYVPESLLRDADLITITCGGNDMMDFMYGVILKAYNEKNPNTPITDIEELKTTIRTDKVRALKLVSAAKKAVTVDLMESAGFQHAVTEFQHSLTNLVGYIRSKNPSAVLTVATQYHPYQAFAVENVSLTQKIFVNFIHTAITPCLTLDAEDIDICTHISAKYSCGCGKNCKDISTCPNQQAEYSYQHADYSCGCGKNCKDLNGCLDKNADYSRCPQTTPLKTLNSVIADNAAPLGYIISDVHSAFERSASKGKDYCNASITGTSEIELDFHPNAAGHAAIAQTVLDTVKSVNDNLAVTPSITQANLSKGTVTISGTGVYTSAFAAFYNADGRMVGVTVQDLDPAQTQTTLSTKLNGTAVSTKVFLLTRDALIPECDTLVWPAP